MTINLNLEIIVDEKQTLNAYRHDLPDDMMHMVINAGHLQIFDEGNQNLLQNSHCNILIAIL